RWAPAGAGPGLTTEDLPPDDVVLVAAAGARLLRGDAPDPDVVAASPLLMPPEGSEVAGRARAELRALGLEPARVVTLGSAAAVRAGVSAGAGLGLGLASAVAARAPARAGSRRARPWGGRRAGSGRAAPARRGARWVSGPPAWARSAARPRSGRA